MKAGSFTGIDGIPNQDVAMWVSPGPIVDRTNDILGASDLAVVEFRRMMVEAARAVARGEPALGTAEAAHPPGRDPLARRHLPEGRRLAGRSAPQPPRRNRRRSRRGDSGMAPRVEKSIASYDARLAEAIRSGFLKPPVLPNAGPLPSAKPVARLQDILDELDADRSER